MRKELALKIEQWFKDMTEEEQKEYIEQHPNSKYAKHLGKGKDKDSDTKEKPAEKKAPVLNPNRTEEDKKLTQQVKEKHGIAIPPAWSDVKFHGPKGDERGVVAEGTDAKGRKQRLENPEYRQGKIKEKHERIEKELTPIMPKVTNKLKRMAAQGDSEEAKVLYLIAKTAFRIGGRGDGKTDKVAYGASTLEGRHAKVEGDTVHFNFVGKGGHEQSHTIKDPVIAKMVEGKDDNEKLFNTSEKKIREEWKKHGGDKVHDMRSYWATKVAKDVVKKNMVVENEKQYKAVVKKASEAAANKLGNKPAESLKTYIDNSVFEGIKIV